MTERELFLFHKNYKFIWSKLSISYYHVKNEDDMATRLNIMGARDLPAYSILSKCYNNDLYEPSVSIVNKIVDFYNQNILPKVDTYQFLHDDLEETASTIHKRNTVYSDRFLGTYYCYYPDHTSGIVGCLMTIYKKEDRGRNKTGYKAAIITGIRNDDSLKDSALRNVFNGEPSVKKYKAYYESQPKHNQRSVYYEGDVETTNESMLITFVETGGEFKKIVLTLNLSGFPSTKKYTDGGIGYLLFTSDGPFDTRFCKMGFTNEINGCLSLRDPRIPEALGFKSIENNVITLTSASDRVWYELVLASLNDGSLIIPATKRDDKNE